MLHLTDSALAPILYPTPDTGVCLFEFELAPRCDVMIRSVDRDGLLFLMVVFRLGTTARERVGALKRSRLAPAVVESITAEVLRDAQAVA